MHAVQFRSKAPTDSRRQRNLRAVRLLTLHYSSRGMRAKVDTAAETCHVMDAESDGVPNVAWFVSKVICQIWNTRMDPGS